MHFQFHGFKMNLLNASRLTLGLYLLLALYLTACSGGGGGGSNIPPINLTSLDLNDPTPGDTDLFGSSLVILGNGNIVVADSGDDTMANNAGAVHLYSPQSSIPIASIYGDDANDQLGSSSITALANNNYVIASELDDEGGIVDAGSVRLVDGATGMPIGTPIVGDVSIDSLGENGIIALANNNYVVASASDDLGGIVNAGSVRLVNGSTGVQIGTPIVGDTADDRLGFGSVTALTNNNYVLASTLDDEGGVVDAGSVRLVDGATGTQIGMSIVGTSLADVNFVNVTESPTGIFFVLGLPSWDYNGLTNSGRVLLVAQ
jgi:hypothetical protein